MSCPALSVHMPKRDVGKISNPFLAIGQLLCGKLLGAMGGTHHKHGEFHSYIECATGALSMFAGHCSGAAAERQSSRACIYSFVGQGGRDLRAPLSVTCERCGYGSHGKAGVCCRPWQRRSAGRRQRLQRGTRFRLSGGGPAGTRWARQAGAASGMPSSRRGP